MTKTKDAESPDDQGSAASHCSPRRESPAFEPHWPEGLETGVFYELPCDDDGHELQARMKVLVANDGDVHVSMSKYVPGRAGEKPERLAVLPSIRVRTLAGGGKNLRTLQALRWLAEAIRLDNEDNPDNAIR